MMATPTHPTGLPRPEPTPSLGAARPGCILFYGCVKCQRCHFQGTPLFWEHRGFQSKHGVDQMPLDHYFRRVSEGN
jgi:hypothetical protein